MLVRAFVRGPENDYYVFMYGSKFVFCVRAAKKGLVFQL